MQTSARTLTNSQEKTLNTDLCTVLTDLHDPQEVAAFLSDFFSPTEQSVFAKRLQIAWLLHQSWSYEAIKTELHVSSATISSVALIKDKPGLHKAFARLKVDAWASSWATKIWHWFVKPSQPSLQ